MTNSPSDAERFRVERAGPFRLCEDTTRGWLVIHSGGGARGERFGWLHREGFFIDENNGEYVGDRNPEWAAAVNGLYYPTEAEATYRLLLYTDPAKALKPFLAANNLEYEGTCGECGGIGEWYMQAYVAGGEIYGPDGGPCSTCHGTGGPPAQHLLAGAADWFWERGCEMESQVLRSVAR